MRVICDPSSGGGICRRLETAVWRRSTRQGNPQFKVAWGTQSLGVIEGWTPAGGTLPGRPATAAEHERDITKQGARCRAFEWHSICQRLLSFEGCTGSNCFMDIIQVAPTACSSGTGRHNAACPTYRKLWRSQLEKYAIAAKIRGADKLERKRHSKSNVMLMSFDHIHTDPAGQRHIESEIDAAGDLDPPASLVNHRVPPLGTQRGRGTLATCAPSSGITS